MLEKLKVRIQNPKVIGAVFSGVLLGLVNTGVIDVKASQGIIDCVNTVLGALVAVGVFGDPESHVKAKEVQA